MSDREKMILIIKQYYEELKPGFRGNPVLIADRLIEAGFRLPVPHDKYKGKLEHDQSGWKPK